jgi:hypothetical protein
MDCLLSTSGAMSYGVRSTSCWELHKLLVLKEGVGSNFRVLFNLVKNRFYFKNCHVLPKNSRRVSAFDFRTHEFLLDFPDILLNF